MAKPRRIEYLPLDSVQPAKSNPKLHADEFLSASVERFGYTEPLFLDERTGRLVAGHGRLDALRRLKEAGSAAPEGVEVKDGQWLVPVVRGWASKDDTEAEAYLLASNQLTIAGGWNETALEEMLRRLQDAHAVAGLGWDEDALMRLLDLAPPETLYTDRIESPVYKPTGPMPAVTELYDTEKQRELSAEIERAEGLSEKERAFLRAAAARHVVFDYQNVAEYYAHASPEMQRLMEKSALVIIDFNQAIENGFVKLTKAIASHAAEEAA